MYRHMRRLGWERVLGTRLLFSWYHRMPKGHLVARLTHCDSMAIPTRPADYGTQEKALPVEDFLGVFMLGARGYVVSWCGNGSHSGLTYRLFPVKRVRKHAPYPVWYVKEPIIELESFTDCRNWVLGHYLTEGARVQ